MKTKTNQDADPGTNPTGTDAGPAPLNSVSLAQGAERLEFISQLIDEPETETEVESDPDSETQTDQTPPAEPAEPAPEPEAEPDADEAEEQEQEQEPDDTEPDDEDAIPGVKPEVQKAINKRIGKEVARRKAAEARIEALEAKLGQPDQATPGTAQLSSATVLDQVTTDSELEVVLNQAREARNYARDAYDRLADEPEAVVTELREAGLRIAPDAEPSQVRAELRKIRRNAEAVLDREQSARKSLSLRANYTAQVAKDFAWANDRTSEEYATYRNVLAHPAVRGRPDADFVAAIVVEGLASYKARTAKKPVPKKTVAKRPAPQPGRPAAARVEPHGSETARQALQVDPSDRNARQKVLARMLAE
jgi:hypothetical protein